MSGKRYMTSTTNRSINGSGMYFLGLSAGLVHISAWWLLLMLPGLALCFWSGWRDAGQQDRT